MSAATQAALPRTFATRALPDSNAMRWAGLGAVILVHLLALFFLLRQTPAREVLQKAAPIMVAVVTPPKVVVPPPPPPPPPRPPPKPRLEPIKAPAPSPPIVVPALPALVEFASPPPAVPAPPAQSEVTAATVAPPLPSPRPAPPAITPPSFNAAYLRNTPPRYPNASRRTGEQGRVVMRVHVSETGSPEQVELHTSSGFERLDRAALDTVRTWKFVPAHQAGKAVAAWVLVPITFALEH